MNHLQIVDNLEHLQFCRHLRLCLEPLSANDWVSSLICVYIYIYILMTCTEEATEMAAKYLLYIYIYVIYIYIYRYV